MQIFEICIPVAPGLGVEIRQGLDWIIPMKSDIPMSEGFSMITIAVYQGYRDAYGSQKAYFCPPAIWLDGRDLKVKDFLPGEKKYDKESYERVLTAERVLVFCLDP